MLGVGLQTALLVFVFVGLFFGAMTRAQPTEPAAMDEAPLDEAPLDEAPLVQIAAEDDVQAPQETTGSQPVAAASDIVERPGAADRPLPPPPEGFVTEENGLTTWTYPAGAAGLVSELRATRVEAWAELEADMGMDIPEQITVRIARDPEEMRRLAPRFAPPPEYATGVAYPARGLIILSTVSPGSWDPPDLHTVFVHELSHIALRRAVGGHPLPRWFVEGLAIVQAREATFERMKTLWQGHLAGEMHSLDDIATRFPSRPHRVNLAYAEAADVVRFLRSQEGDDRRFIALIEELEEGDSFASALSDAYALTPGQLERDWREALEERVTALPLLVGFSSIWAFAGFLLVAAWIRRRRDHKRRLAEMGAKEDADNASIDRLEALAQEWPKANVMPRTDSTVPTVKHDGHEHTLH